MNKDVLLSIRGLHFTDPDDDAEPVEVIAPAEYYLRNGKHYILYSEITEEQAKPTKVKVKIEPNLVEITRKGLFDTKMLFEKGKKHLTCYTTPFGSLMLSIITNQIEISQDEAQLSLKIDYLLESDYEPVADCKIELRVTEKDASLFSLEN